MAGSRTRVNCLEGSYADRYNTITFVLKQYLPPLLIYSVQNVGIKNAGKYSIKHKCDGGITVSIAAFQAVDPGSTPGHRNQLLNK